MSRVDIPSGEDLYEEAKKLDGFHTSDHELGDSWGEAPAQETLSNYFVWDLEPGRFYYTDNTPEELVVLPNVYGAFLNGTAFSMVTPLENEEDFNQAWDVFGPGSLTEFKDGVPAVKELDTPLDTLELHYLADDMDVDLYTLDGNLQLDDWVEEGKSGVVKQWTRTASSALDDLLGAYTIHARSSTLDEAGMEFSGNGKKTAFVFYANRENPLYSEFPIEAINNDYNRGDLAYHTPLTAKKVLE